MPLKEVEAKQRKSQEADASKAAVEKFHSRCGYTFNANDAYLQLPIKPTSNIREPTKNQPLSSVCQPFYDRPPISSSSSKKKSSSDVRVTNLSADFRLAVGDPGAISNSVSPPSREYCISSRP
jgi:hypothetical protein